MKLEILPTPCNLFIFNNFFNFFIVDRNLYLYKKKYIYLLYLNICVDNILKLQPITEYLNVEGDYS